MYYLIMSNETWKIIYYEDINSNSEIFNFVESLKTNLKVKVLNWFLLLSEKGPNLTRPYSDILEDGIHELRIKLTGDQVRILYFFCYKDFIILTHYFKKNSDKVPEKEIKKAKDFRNDFLHRYNEAELRRFYNENI